MTLTETKPQITTYTELPYRLLSATWEMYTEAFEPMRTKAAQSHVMRYEDFRDLMGDERVDKVLVQSTDVTRTPLGLACVTNDLAALSLIEPRYFEARHPELYAANHVWYVAFVCVRQVGIRPPADTFGRIINRMAEPIRPVQGVCYMDYARCNVENGLALKARKLLGSNCAMERADAQETWGYWPEGRPA